MCHTFRRSLPYAGLLAAVFLLAACGSGAGEPTCDDENIPEPAAPFCGNDDELVRYADTPECVVGQWVYQTLVEYCGEDGFVCRDAQCVDPAGLSGGTDPRTTECENICPTVDPGPPFCEGDIVRELVAIEQNPVSCECEQVFNDEDCATSGEVCEEGACVNPGTTGPDCTADIDCADDASPTCDGDEVVTSAPTCNTTTGTCEAGEDRTDCAAQDQVCEEGACVDATPECTVDTECSPADEPACDGDEVVTPTGTCDTAAGSCTFDEDRTDCAAIGRVCEDAECVLPDGSCEGEDDCVGATPPYCDEDELVSDAGTCNTVTGLCEAVRTLVEDCTESGRVCVDTDDGPSECAFDEVECAGDDQCINTTRYCDDSTIMRIVGTCDTSEDRCDFSDEVAEVCDEGSTCEPSMAGGVVCVAEGECPDPCPVLDLAPPTCEGDTSRQLVTIEQNEDTCACEEVWEVIDCTETARYCADEMGCVACTASEQCNVIGTPTCEDNRVVGPVPICEDFECDVISGIIDDCEERGATCDIPTATCLETM